MKLIKMNFQNQKKINNWNGSSGNNHNSNKDNKRIIEMENKILLLTEEDMYDIEHNKNLKVKKIKQGFELFEIGDKELKGAILKINNIDKPLEEVKDTCYLAKSELYNKNVYYPIDKYDECYEADFYKIISSVTFNMGASYIKIYAKN